MRYAVVIEKAGSNYSAYVPDLPGCIATGATVEEVEIEIRDAIRFHIEACGKTGCPSPSRSAVQSMWTRELQKRPTPRGNPFDG